MSCCSHAEADFLFLHERSVFLQRVLEFGVRQRHSHVRAPWKSPNLTGTLCTTCWHVALSVYGWFRRTLCLRKARVASVFPSSGWDLHVVATSKRHRAFVQIPLLKLPTEDDLFAGDVTATRASLCVRSESVGGTENAVRLRRPPDPGWRRTHAPPSRAAVTHRLNAAAPHRWGSHACVALGASRG